MDANMVEACEGFDLSNLLWPNSKELKNRLVQVKVSYRKRKH